MCGTANVLTACARAGVRRLVYVSSAEVYGLRQEGPVAEEHSPVPRSPYGAAKLAAEHFIQALAPGLAADVFILRPFSVYGPGLPRRSVVGTLLYQALFADAIMLHDLRTVRDYCYLDDVVDAVLRACYAPTLAHVRAYNVGSGVGTSVGRLCRLALEVLAGRHRSAKLGWQIGHGSGTWVVSSRRQPGRRWNWAGARRHRYKSDCAARWSG